MNTSSKILLVLFAGALGLLVARTESVEVPVQAQTITPAVPEQYLVIDASQVPVGNRQDAPITLEKILNEQGAQGWHLRATMNTFLIMAR